MVWVASGERRTRVGRNEYEWKETNASGERRTRVGRDELEWKEVACEWVETNSSGARRMEKATLSATVANIIQPVQ